MLSQLWQLRCAMASSTKQLPSRPERCHPPPHASCGIGTQGIFPQKNGKPGCWYEYFSQTANQLSKILRIHQNKHQKKKRASRNKKHIQPNLNIQSNVKSPDARLLMTSRTEASASRCAPRVLTLQKFVKDQSESNYIWRLSELSVFLEFSSFCHRAHMTHIRSDKK